MVGLHYYFSIVDWYRIMYTVNPVVMELLKLPVIVVIIQYLLGVLYF